MEDVHERFMWEALKMARRGLEQGELPIGAVVVLNNEIIAAAYTMEKAEGRLLIHADLLALEAADKIKPFPGKRRDAALYVTGEPCLMCLGAAMSFFLGEIYYGHECPGDGAVALVQQWQRKEEDFPTTAFLRSRVVCSAPGRQRVSTDTCSSQHNAALQVTGVTQHAAYERGEAGETTMAIAHEAVLQTTDSQAIELLGQEQEERERLNQKLQNAYSLADVQKATRLLKNWAARHPEEQGRLSSVFEPLFLAEESACEAQAEARSRPARV